MLSQDSGKFVTPQYFKRHFMESKYVSVESGERRGGYPPAGYGNWV